MDWNRHQPSTRRAARLRGYELDDILLQVDLLPLEAAAVAKPLAGVNGDEEEDAIVPTNLRRLLEQKLDLLVRERTARMAVLRQERYAVKWPTRA